MVRFATAPAFGAVAPGINKRRVAFFQIRGSGRRDVGALSFAGDSANGYAAK